MKMQDPFPNREAPTAAGARRYVTKEECDLCRGHIMRMAGDLSKIQLSFAKLEGMPDTLKAVSDKVMEMDVTLKGLTKDVDEQEEITGDIQIETAVVHRRVSDMTDLSKRKTNWFITGVMAFLTGIAGVLLKYFLDKKK
jgi:hypothetical protein